MSPWGQRMCIGLVVVLAGAAHMSAAQLEADGLRMALGLDM